VSNWDGDDLALLARTASDLTALAATIEVLRRRRPSDPAIQRAGLLVDRLLTTVSELVQQLRN
jgi:hypothetical protein